MKGTFMYCIHGVQMIHATQLQLHAAQQLNVHMLAADDQNEQCGRPNHLSSVADCCMSIDGVLSCG